jgi:hypothetical protein
MMKIFIAVSFVALSFVALFGASRSRVEMGNTKHMSPGSAADTEPNQPESLMAETTSKAATQTPARQSENRCLEK